MHGPYSLSLHAETVVLVPGLALAYGLGARARGLAPPSRAPLLLRSGDAPLVAGHPRQPAPALGRLEGGVPVRCVRARESARAPARAPPERRLRLLRTRAAALGLEPARRPAARRDHDGRRASRRLLRRLRVLLPALHAGGGPGGRDSSLKCRERPPGVWRPLPR